jgi:hypothetical protein
MKTKGCWAIAVLLACGALTQLAVSSVAPPGPYSEAKLEEFRGTIRAQRQALGDWINDPKGDPPKFVHQYAMTLNPRGRAVGPGRAAVVGKWKKIKDQLGKGKIGFETAKSRIEFIPARFLIFLGEPDAIPYDLVAIEFGTFVFTGEPEAESGPAVAAQPVDGDYCAIWGHKEDCNWGIITEIEY